MKIAYVLKNDRNDVHVWSGTSYYVLKTLREQHFEVYVIDNLNRYVAIPFFVRIKVLLYSLFKKSYDFNRDPAYLKKLAAYIGQKLLPGTDCILSPTTLLMAFLKSGAPKITYTDATFAGMLDFYYPVKSFSPGFIKQANRIEKKALEDCRLAIFSSQWAADSAMKNYDVSSEKIKVVPLGANIDEQRTLADINEIIKRRSNTTCRLLFVGTEWERKGGAFAVNVAKILNDKGVKTELHIVGPEKDLSSGHPDFIVQHGFLSKKKPDELALLNKLFSESHFFILPTKAEAYGLTLCEANSFGLPCLANRVGGIPAIITDDVNGKLFRADDSENEYADYILSIFHDQHAYVRLCQSAFIEYEERLNWRASGTLLKKYINEAIGL